MSLPEKFDHYEIQHREDGSLWELGRGAMGVTYKAWDCNLHCAAALKIINPGITGSGESHERFLREARAAAALRHPNIATVFHLGQAGDSTFFYAMEFCDGPTLQEEVKAHGAFGHERALEVALQISRALMTAEARHIVHRDIKPSNLILTQRHGEGLVVKVIDFGLAKNLNAAAQSVDTPVSSGFVGTAHFASPEQLEEKDVDIRSDFYSLGICLWFMLTGRPPFEGPLARVMAQTLSDEPPWERLATQAPPVISLMRRLLSKDPAGRPSSAAALRNEIESCILQAGVARAPKPWAQAILNPAAAPPGRESPASQRKAAPATSGPIQKVSATPRRESLSTLRRPLPESVNRELLFQKYKCTAELRRDSLGIVYEGVEWATGTAVTVRLFDSAVMAVPEIRRQVQAQVQALIHHPHPALPQILAWGEHAGEWVLISSSLDGVTLLEILKARGSLLLDETLALLDVVAETIAQADAHGFGPLRPNLGTIRVVPPDEFANIPALLKRPLGDWGKCRVLVDCLAFDHIARGCGLQTGVSSGRTVAGPINRDLSGGIPSSAALVASLICEMLGSTPFIRGNYVPLPLLNRIGNQLLRTVFEGAPEDAREMISKLRACSGPDFFHSPREDRTPADGIDEPAAPRSRKLLFTILVGVPIFGLCGSLLAWYYHVRAESARTRVAAATKPKAEDAKKPPDRAAQEEIDAKKRRDQEEKERIDRELAERAKEIEAKKMHDLEVEERRKAEQAKNSGSWEGRLENASPYGSAMSNIKQNTLLKLTDGFGIFEMDTEYMLLPARTGQNVLERWSDPTWPASLRGKSDPFVFRVRRSAKMTRRTDQQLTIEYGRLTIVGAPAYVTEDEWEIYARHLERLLGDKTSYLILDDGSLQGEKITLIKARSE